MKKRAITLLALLLAALLLLSNMMVLAEYDEPVADGVDPISREVDEYILGGDGDTDGDGEAQDLAGLLGLSDPDADDPGLQGPVFSNDDAQQTFDSIDEDSMDNDALFEGYIRKTLPGLQTVNGLEIVSNASPYAGRASLVRQELTGSVVLYDALRPLIEDVAAGQRASTVFTFDAAALGTEDHWWTADELGLFSFETGNIGGALMAKDGIDFKAIITALLDDCPFDLYWFDKTQGWTNSFEIFTRTAGEDVQANLSSVTLSMTVAEAYASSAYTLNALPARVATAAANIDQIISVNAGLGDLEKLTAYANKICELVEYNHPAADDASTPYGDPWQLVFIFDGDDDTKVVCEGYSKGFKYLCDISSFAGNVACVTVSGDLIYDTGSGPHMWNSLRMPDGKCYLVDLTNCDAGDSCSGTLFLKGCAGSAGGPYTCAGLGYQFDDNTISFYGAGSEWLMLSNTDYGAQEGTSTSTPETTTPAPETTTPAPETTTPAPETTTPAPETTTPAPETTTPAPETTTPAPETTTPAPAPTSTQPTDPPGHTDHSLDLHNRIEPSCITNGTEAYWECTVCHKLFSDAKGNNEITTSSTIPALGHSWDGGEVTTAASCGKTGVKTYTCANCGGTKTEIIPALEHAWDNGVITTAAGCETPGVKTYTCANCGETRTEVFDATGHTPVVDPRVEPTDTETGLTEGSHCGVCGKVLVAQEVIPVLTPTPTPEPTPPARLPISKGKITGIKDQVYTGKAITLTPVVKYGGKKLTLGEDYSVSYKNNKKIGTATVTITGKGDYTGSVKKTFAINPAAVELTDLAGDKKKLTVQWIKGGGGVGYELQYDTSKSFKSATTVTVSKSKASHTIKKLQSRKKYYVRIRAFKKVSGKMYYSKWSKSKSAKTS